MNNMMVIGRFEGDRFEGYRLINLDNLEVSDFTFSEIEENIKSNSMEVRNLTICSNGHLECTHDDTRFGIVGKSNSFVVIKKRIVFGGDDGILLTISDTNGKVIEYMQNEAARLGFYEFANAKVDTIDRTIYIPSESNVPVENGSSLEERKLRAIGFVKDLQRSNICVVNHKAPHANEHPTEYALTSLGRVGYIATHIGTNWFNADITTRLNFKGVVVDKGCRTGFDTFTGWRVKSKEVIYLPKWDFDIDEIACYGDDFLNDSNYRKDDYAYSVRLAWLNAIVYVLRNNEIGKVRLLKAN